MDPTEPEFYKSILVWGDARPSEATAARIGGKLGQYDEGWTVLRVRADGSIVLPGRALFLSKILDGEPVGLHLQEDGSQRIQYGPLFLGSISAEGRFTRGSRKPRRSWNPDDERNEIPTP